MKSQAKEAKFLKKLIRQDNLVEAEKLIRVRARKRNDPKSPAIIQRLAFISIKMRRIEYALLLADQLSKLAPSSPNYQTFVGNIFAEAKRFTTAKKAYLRAISANPAHLEASMNLASMLSAIGQYDEAERYAQKATEIQPCTQTQIILAKIAVAQSDFQKAERVLSDIISIDPLHYESLFLLGKTQRLLNKFERSRSVLIQAANIQKTDELIFELSLCELGLANYPKAWELYESRFKAIPTIKFHGNLDLPAWVPQNIQQTKILLWGEQGIGDEIMFSNFLRKVEAPHPVEITLVIDQRLISAIGDQFDQTVKLSPRQHSSMLKESDYHAQLCIGSIPLLVSQKQLATKNDCDSPQQKIRPTQPKKIKKVGISWHTNSPDTGALRSIDFELITNALHSFDLVNLQYSQEPMPAKLPSHVKTPNFDLKNDIDLIVSEIHNCDLIVTIDNYLAHLCGFIGAPTIVLLPRNCDWRWECYLTTEGYPTVRQIRQQKIGCWDSALKELGEQLSQLQRTDI